MVPWPFAANASRGKKTNNPNWENYLLLLTIMDYVLAPILSLDCIGYIKSLINEHHQTFKELYPTTTLSLKFHYLIHYPEEIERLGECGFRVYSGMVRGEWNSVHTKRSFPGCVIHVIVV